MNLAAWILLGLLLWIVAPVTLWALCVAAVRFYDRRRYDRRLDRELAQLVRQERDR